MPIRFCVFLSEPKEKQFASQTAQHRRHRHDQRTNPVPAREFGRSVQSAGEFAVCTTDPQRRAFTI